MVWVPSNKRFRDKKPREKVLLNRNAYTRPHVCLIFNEQSGTPIDLAGNLNNIQLSTSTPPNWSVTNDIDFNFPLNSYATCALDLSHTNKVCVFAEIYNGADGNDDALGFEFTPNTNANNGFFFDPRYSGGTDYHTSNRLGALQSTRWANPGTGWHKYLFYFGGSGTSQQRIFVDGIEKSLTYVANNSLTGNFANSTLFFASRNATSLFGAYSFRSFMLFDRWLDEIERAELFDAPYKILLPRSFYYNLASAGSVLSSSGAATVSGVGSSLNTQSVTSAGVGALSGVGSSTNTQDFTSAGVAALTGVGSSLNTQSFGFSGSTTAAFIGSSAGSSLSSNGLTSVTFTGGSLFDATLAVAGATTAAFVGSSTGSTLSSAGATSVSFAGTSLYSGVASASGTTTPSFVGESLVAATLSSTGATTAAFVSSVSAFTMSGSTVAAFIAKAAAEELTRLPLDPYLPYDVTQLRKRIYDLYRIIAIQSNKIADEIDKLNDFK